VRRGAAILSLGLAFVVGVGDVATVAAHGERNANVRAVLPSPLPAELAGMRIEVHQTVGPQVVFANPTTHVVEVLDDHGLAFLRIGPDGVAGNVAAAAWFQTYGPGVPVPASARSRDGEPRWVRARDEPSFGWFDPRLDASAIELPHAMLDAGVTTEVGRWQIPLRVDGKPVTLAGRFRYKPPPSGAYAATLTSPAEIAPGVRVRLLPGPLPGLLVKNGSRLPLTVLDDGGEPLLRIGPDGVEANVGNAAWARSGRRTDTPANPRPAEPGVPHWQLVARAASYSWLDPRLAGRETPPTTRALTSKGSSEPVAWQIPVLLGETPLRLTGTTVWKTAHSSDEVFFAGD
jgi:hypothetical protein